MTGRKLVCLFLLGCAAVFCARMSVSAAEDELRGMGITLDGSPADIMLLTDYVCWQYANRDKNEDNGKVCQSHQCELRCFLADEVVTH